MKNEMEKQEHISYHQNSTNPESENNRNKSKIDTPYTYKT